MFLCHTQGSPYFLSPLFLNILFLLSLCRDQIFDMLFRSIEQDASMNGLPQKSLHLFSHEDSIVPPQASMQAMYLYDNPRMMIRHGEHDPDWRVGLELPGLPLHQRTVCRTSAIRVHVLVFALPTGHVFYHTRPVQPQDP